MQLGGVGLGECIDFWAFEQVSKKVVSRMLFMEMSAENLNNCNWFVSFRALFALSSWISLKSECAINFYIFEIIFSNELILKNL